MDLFVTPDIGTAWLMACRHLISRSTTKSGRQSWDLAVEVTDPTLEPAAVRSVLDAELQRLGLPSVATVANTIFPSSLWRSSGSRREFFERYRSMVPRLRAFRKNRHGLYFDRLTAWPPGGAEPLNQVDRVIERIISERAPGGGHLRFVYDMSVFSPGEDPRPMGFPCLAYLNVKVDGDVLRLTAHYRNHYFVERAYGNYLGLAHLQAFIAHETNLDLGPLTCISGHAELESKHDVTFIRRITELSEESLTT